MYKGTHEPTLKFTPYAWAKLLFMRDMGDSEVGGFGISSEKDLFLIEDFQLVQQECTTVTVSFDDESVADFFEDQIEQGKTPEQVGRVWIHTHPDIGADPSGTDEDTFARVFGSSHWSVMFILAKGGQTYSRLQFGVGPTASLEIPSKIDFSQPFPGSEHEDWEEEYHNNVNILKPKFYGKKGKKGKDWWEGKPTSEGQVKTFTRYEDEEIEEEEDDFPAQYNSFDDALGFEHHLGGFADDYDQYDEYHGGFNGV